MTEQEWLECVDPLLMLRRFTRRDTVTKSSPVIVQPSERKIRLAGCGCVRQLWSRLAEKSRKCVEAAESLADGAISKAACNQTWIDHDRDDTVNVAARCLAGAYEPVSGTENAIRHMRGVHPYDAVWADLFRDVVGNPFRQDHNHIPYHRMVDLKTPTVISLTQAAYDERQENGMLDPIRLAILADALEESGCTYLPIMNHLRSQRWSRKYGWQSDPTMMHVRGCFALDLLLEKS